MDFKKSLQDQLGEHDPTDVDELILDDLFKDIDNFTSEHKKTLELYNGLVHLSLNGLGLKSLKNFPKLDTLEVLEIRQNKLNGSDFAELKSLYPSLRKLKVGENPIKSLDSFKIFTGFSKLKKLELVDSDVTNKETYRDELFRMLTNVEVIDRMTREGDEIDSSIYDEGESEEFDDEDMEDFDDEDDEGLDEEDEDDFEDEEESDPAPKKKAKH